MRKIVLFLVILILGTTAFAAAPKATPAKAPATSSPVVVSTAPVVTRIGVLTQGSPGGFGSVATFGTRFNPGLSGDLGLAVGQNAAGANTNIGIVLRLEFDGSAMGEVKTHAGGSLLFASNPAYAAAATSALTLSVFAGLEYQLLKNLSVLADLTLLEITSSGGNTSFGLGAGTALGTGLGTSAATIYGGLRLYL
ncbi:hypothetical protein HZB08_01005 [Candidatus Saganbacteria bacterium]|uniref:Outer membrane protein beta-barrel domain-containing protein n=1 Tax=Candidatus Saganbacteria bacterium TaxID=2575572 RepID=A0A9D6YSW8_UNCSA|nr:hypothetical protein [Candidatus Saganbacteria bacterium]